MASEIRTETSYLERDLTENSAAYDYFQAIRMINLLGRDLSRHDNKNHKLNIKPKLSFDYPSSDIDNISIIESEEEKEFSITTTFMGLYGVSSPLPAYFTEELLDDEWDDIKAPKGFLDVIHQHLYPILFKAWLKYKFSHNAIERNDNNYWDLLFSLIGIGTKEAKSAIIFPERFIRYVGIISNRSRSATGLQAIIQDYLKDYHVEVISCVMRNVAIPEKQRLMLGANNCILGDDAVLGMSIIDRSGKFIVRIDASCNENLSLLKNNTKIIEFIKFIIKSYLIQPLEFDLIIGLSSDSVQGATLGNGEWSCLGHDSWLNMGDKVETVDMLIS